MQYAATWESVRTHPVPAWFNNVKLGVLVTWGLFSVPGWAPRTGDFDQVVKEQGWETFFREQPYAEWYWNSIKFPDSPARRYHEATYGAQFPYEGFVPLFEEAAVRMHPEAWANLWQRAGVRYCIFLTKHHDGYLLWPSRHPNPRKVAWQLSRDVPAELAEACRARGIHFGVYYSGGIDDTFDNRHIKVESDVFAATPQDPGYVAYCDAHWRELVERYEPCVLWGDIAHPVGSDLPALFSWYYNRLPEGVVNDRFGQAVVGENRQDQEIMGPPPGRHYDFRTPEYSRFGRILEEKWELCRGLAHTFSFNRNEEPEDYLSEQALLELLADVVSKNGNLLLSFGPMADGTVPELQRERLLALGAWLQTNGDAIYGTRPWTRAEGRTGNGLQVRFTAKGNDLYAIVLGRPAGDRLVLQGMRGGPETRVQLLGHNAPLAWQPAGEGLALALPEQLPPGPAVVFQFTPAPAAWTAQAMLAPACASMATALHNLQTQKRR